MERNPWVGERYPVAWAHAMMLLKKTEWIDWPTLVAELAKTGGILPNSADGLLRDAVKAGALIRVGTRYKNADKRKVKLHPHVPAPWDWASREESRAAA